VCTTLAETSDDTYDGKLNLIPGRDARGGKLKSNVKRGCERAIAVALHASDVD
jgi:hypothetical protein